MTGNNPMYIVEARKPDGTLCLDLLSQPPWSVASERQLFKYYSEHSGRTAYQGEPGHRELVVEWFKAKGWAIRPKTW